MAQGYFVLRSTRIEMAKYAPQVFLIYTLL